MSKHHTNENGRNKLFVSQVGSGSRTSNQSEHVAKVHGARQEEKDNPFVQHEVEEKFTKEEILQLLIEQCNGYEVHLSETPD